ncbi:MAG: hypothetical protein KIT14_13480 [bacterium]|nr:hypothetical protein [bacterium]
MLSGRRAIALAALLALPAHVPDAYGASAAQRCEAAVAAAATACTKKVAARTRACYLGTGDACLPGDAGVARALAKLGKKILKGCPDAASARGAGYGALVDPAAVVARTREACLGEPATLAARTFGGPQGAVLGAADPTLRRCLDTAYRQASTFLLAAYDAQRACIRKARRGACNVAKTAAKVATLEGKALAAIAKRCAPAALPDAIGLDGAVYLARTGAQARCLTATAHGDPGPLDLDCGPRPSIPLPARGEWVQITLDEAVWGTRCGKGAPYAFWLRLAPEGADPTNVATDMEGGGVCLGESDCAGIPNSLWLATDNEQPNDGYLSTDAAINPFHDWTMLFMPYCTQDVHIGGGLSSVFSPSLTVHRFGAVNVRAAMRYLRDVLWTELERSDPAGWHPDRLHVFFSGESAGGFGVNYNYHYPLDDLRWVNTTAAPDSGLGLDNGTALSVKTLGSVITGTTNPGGWGTRPFQPPYCLSGDCAVGPIGQAASAPRLLATPWQRVLNLSNQVDATQVSTTFFPSTAAFVNAVRADYCTNRGLPGLHFFFPARTASIHTMLRTNSLFTTLAAGGVVVRDYVHQAMTNPAGVVDHVDEGTLVADYPGVQPIACAGSPSGAFLD